MIKLSKGPKPPILEDEADSWTAALIEKIACGEKPTKSELGQYRHPQIKAALLLETHRKCAYCESKFAHVSFGDVEHVTPKSKKPELTFCWENLTLACQVCNNGKSDHDDVLDPYKHEPSDHLHFEGTALVPRPGSDIGFLTERRLSLNRVELIEARKRRRDSLYTMAEAAAKNTNVDKKRVLLQLLNDEMAADREYAAMCAELVPRYMRYASGS